MDYTKNKILIAIVSLLSLFVFVRCLGCGGDEEEEPVTEPVVEITDTLAKGKPKFIEVLEGVQLTSAASA